MGTTYRIHIRKHTKKNSLWMSTAMPWMLTWGLGYRIRLVLTISPSYQKYHCETWSHNKWWIFSLILNQTRFEQLSRKTHFHWLLVLGFHHSISVGTVLIFQFSLGFGTKASVPAIPQCLFWYLSSGSYYSIPGFLYKVYGGLFALFSFWYWFGSILVPFRLHIGSISNPNHMESTALGTNLTGT